eukprot:8363173-Heterocapsa_arctica.AAC.1
MFEKPSQTFNKTPEDRSTTFNNHQNLQNNTRRHVKNLQTHAKPSKPRAPVCAPVGRTEI